MPRQRFQHPEDAPSSSSAPSACHERLFGRRPVGLWPSEGSVSDAIVPLVAKAGFEWMATDELILARTLGIDVRAMPAGRSTSRERLYAPYRLAAGGAQVALRLPRSRAVGPDRLPVRRLGAGGRGRRLRRRGWPKPAAVRPPRTGGEEPTIFVILDGENAWEHFEGGGRPFCGRSIGGCRDHPELRTVTMAEACAGAGADADRHLPRLVDRRELLHLDRPRRRPAGLEPARRGARRARDAPARRTTTARRAGARRDPDRRRQRLVLVVRRRPLVGPRRGVRRPVPAASAERLPAASASRARRTVRDATSRRAPRPRRRSTRPA